LYGLEESTVMEGGTMNMSDFSSKLFRRLQLSLVIVFCVFGLLACATEVPKYSHIHVGHALNGWVNTPGQKGLFVTTEEFADRIARLSVSSIEASRKSDFATVRKNSEEIIRLIGDDPRAEIAGPDSYTFLTALQGAVNHLAFAVESDDASQNLQKGIQRVIDNSATLFARTDVLRTLAEVAMVEPGGDPLSDVAREIRVLAVQNLEGEDINKDNFIGDTPEEYGLRQLRRDLAATIENERPPFRPVEQRYLFGLVRLPDGSWQFRDPDSGGGTYGRYSY